MAIVRVNADEKPAGERAIDHPAQATSAHSAGTSRVLPCSAIMEEDDTSSPPDAPAQSPFRRLRQRRGVIARLDNTAAAYRPKRALEFRAASYT